MLRFAALRSLVPYVAATGLASVSFATCDPHTVATAVQQVADQERHRSFSPKEFRKFPIKAVKDLSPNTKAFEVTLPSSHHEMVCMHNSSIIWRSF